MDCPPSFKNLYVPTICYRPQISWDINLLEPSYWFILLFLMWPYHPLHVASQGTHSFLYLGLLFIIIGIKTLSNLALQELHFTKLN